MVKAGGALLIEALESRTLLSASLSGSAAHPLTPHVRGSRHGSIVRKAALSTATTAYNPPPVPSTDPYASEINAFETADRVQLPAPGQALFVGSSSIRRWTTLAQDFSGIPVINRGFGGAHIADVTRYANLIVTPYKPKVIIFYAGDDDIGAGRTPAQILADYQKFVAAVQPQLPTTKIYFVSIKPAPHRWPMIDAIRQANLLVKNFSATQSNLGYIDIFSAMLGSNGLPIPSLFLSDGEHMTPAGYKIWTSIITPYATAGVAPSLVDDLHAVKTGTWTSSTYVPGFYGSDYLNDGNTAKGLDSVTFTPALPSAGTYEVFARWTAGTTRATNVPYTIHSASGTSTVFANQQVKGGVWNQLGAYTFNAGTGGNVIISNAGTNGFVIADAIVFVRIS